MITTRVFSQTLEAYLDPSIRNIINEGGSRSTKTWSELQLLYLIADSWQGPVTISVVSESVPHLKRGVIRDFETILRDEGVYDRDRWHDTDKIYHVTDNKIIEFFSADSPGKVKGPARDILFMNEAINTPYEAFRQLSVRTRHKVFLDHNPSWEYWADTKLIPRADTKVIHSTYKDNPFLTAFQIAEIEAERDADPEWFNVYGLGLKGTREGLVITNWDIVSDWPKGEVKYDSIVVDFGWTAPTAIERCGYVNGEVYIDQIAYKRNLTNPMIAEEIKAAGLTHLEVLCDSAEQKSIEELKSYGLKAVGAQKPKGSIGFGIQIMNRIKKHYTARSIDSIQENRTYRYKPNLLGGYTDEPVKGNDHAKDAERYWFLKYLADSVPSFSFGGTASK